MDAHLVQIDLENMKVKTNMFQGKSVYGERRQMLEHVLNSLSVFMSTKWAPAGI